MPAAPTSASATCWWWKRRAAAAGAPLADAPPAAAPGLTGRRRWAWLAAGGLALALALGAWFGPRLLDWDAWREELADLAGSRLGRDVAIGGRITLVLLPQPRVEAAGVTIGPAGDDVSVTARAMRLRLDLPALLAGRLELREIILSGGEIQLPWPPAGLPGWRPFVQLSAFDARLEDSRLRIGGLQIDGLNARLVTGGATEALVAEGSFAWRGYAVRFGGQLGRAGFDGVAPLDLTLAAVGSTLAARGTLAEAGGFEGRLEASGADLAALLPVPQGAWRATGRVTATADLFAADDLALDLNGLPARGAATLRLAPAQRLDIALAAGRLDLEAWLAALRGARGTTLPATLPVSIDLSAEATQIGPIPLRRLRGGFFLQGDRLSFADVAAVLPGDTAVELAGATAGPRIELAVHFTGRTLRDTLATLGLPVAGTDPSRLRVGEGRFKLVLQGNEAAVSDLVATIDGARIGGAGVLRQGAVQGARPVVGLGLTVDRLTLDGVLPDALDPVGWLAGPPPIDLNLRLAADSVTWHGLVATRGSLDLTIDQGRAALRRLGFQAAGLDVGVAGGVVYGAAPRIPELSLEVSGGDGGALAALLPAGWGERLPLTGQPVALRLSASGTPDALALRVEGDLGELRAEATGSVDAGQRRGAASLTLRHPGAPRLLRPLLGATGWLGPGSFSVIGNLSGGITGDAAWAVTAEHLDLVAGGLRGRGQMTLSVDGGRPRLAGRFAADSLPLPLADLGAPVEAPLGLERLGALDADLALEAARLETGGPLLEGVAAQAKLVGGTLRLEGLRARLAGGTLQGQAVVEAAAQPPRLTTELVLDGLALAGPLLDLPFDIGPGRVGSVLILRAAGHSPAALAATLQGSAEVQLRDGVLVGLDLGALPAAAALADPAAAEAALRAALAGGATAVETLEARATLAEGQAVLDRVAVGTAGGGAAEIGGRIDMARGAVDLRFAAQPVAEAPEVALRVTGPAAAPRRLPELAPFLRWRAER